jgi:hypothetical protein
MDSQKILAKLEKNEALTADEITFLKALKTLTPESVKDYLEKDETGKKYLQSLNDAAVTKGITTFKEKTMPGLIEDAIKIKFPAETEEQKRLRLQDEKIAALETANKKKDLLNKAISIATEKKLPLKLVERFVGEDEESTSNNIALLETEFNNTLKVLVDEKFKAGGREPNTGNSNPAEDYSQMSDAEYFAARTKK